MDKKTVESAFERIAESENRSVEEIKGEIQKAIDESYVLGSDEVREFYRQIPSEFEIPSANEVVLYLTKLANNQINGSAQSSHKPYEQ